MGHGRVICKQCKKVIRSCRCFKCAENIIETICEECLKEVDTVEINAPWGTRIIDENTAGNTVELIKYVRDQLIYFKNAQNNQTEHLRRDLEGYEMILDSSNPEHNAKHFIRTKQKHHGTKRFKDNLEVIDYLKKGGLWQC